MAKYKIIPSSRTIVQSPISIGHKAEKGVQAIEFDLTAWVETYGSGTLTVIMRRWGDAIPYPIALEIDENNKATWTLSDIDTAKAGMAYAQLNYIVGDEVVKKSDIYTFRVMDSLVGEGEPPEAYEAWLEHLTHLAAEAMAEVLDIEGIVTDKTLTVDGGIADGKATGDALALKADKSTTYTKTEVDRMIEGVEIETDTTLTIEGAAADAAETGRQIDLLKADLDSQIDEIYNDIDDQIPAWEQGTLSTNSGGEPSTDANNRCRTSDYKKVESPIIGIYIKDGYKVNVFIYSGTTVASYESNIGWKSGQIRLYGLSGKYVRFIIAHTDDATLEYSDVPADALEAVLYDPTDKTLTKSGKTADAKVVGDFVSKIAVSNTIYPTWQKKTINGSSGAETDNPRRLSTVEFIESIGLPISVSCNSGYMYSLRYYTDAASTSMFGSTNWMTGEYTVPITDGQYFKVVVSKTDDTNIDLSEGTAIHISFGGYTDYNLTQHNKAADAKTVGEKIQALEKITGNNIVGRNNPAEMTLKLQQLNQIPRVESHTYGNKPLCLLHFSDIHNDQVRLQNIVDFAGYYTDYIDDVVNTGDTVYYRAADGLSAWENVSGTEAILNTIGNHDTRVDNTWIGLTEAESYNMYIAPYISNWNVTDYSTGHCYYYKDYATEKVRLIILDIMHQTTEQLNWFVSALASAKQNEYHVLVGVHSRAHWNFDSYDVTWDDKKIVSGYAAGYQDTSGTHYPENLSNDYADAVDAFIADGGYFVAWIHGHTHFKMFAKLFTHPNQLDVAVANAGIVPFARTYVDARIDNSKSEDSFNVLAIDTTSKILRIASVGSTYDRIMRLHDTISYNYETHELLYSR